MPVFPARVPLVLLGPNQAFGGRDALLGFGVRDTDKSTASLAIADPHPRARRRLDHLSDRVW